MVQAHTTTDTKMLEKYRKMYLESFESCPDSEDLTEQNSGAVGGGKGSQMVSQSPTLPLKHMLIQGNGWDLVAGPCQSSLEKNEQNSGTQCYYAIRNPEPKDLFSNSLRKYLGLEKGSCQQSPERSSPNRDK